MQQSVKLRGHVHKLSPLSAVKYSDHALDSHSIPASLSGMSKIQGVLHIHTHTGTNWDTKLSIQQLLHIHEYKKEAKHHLCLVKCSPPVALNTLTFFNLLRMKENNRRKKPHRECTESSNFFFSFLRYNYLHVTKDNVLERGTNIFFLILQFLFLKQLRNIV